MPDVTIDVHGSPMPAYLALPAEARTGGVVVIQEIFGLNASMRAITDSFAKAGFLALCPDLFWRQGLKTELLPGSEDALAQARERAARATDGEMVADLRAAVSHLREMEPCNGRVGTVGYCMGGRLAFLMACRADTQCNVVYYGTRLDQYLEEADRLTRPLMLHIAQADEHIPPAVQEKIHRRLDKCGGVTIHDYPGVGHAFARPEYGNPEATALANRRTIDFLQLHLR